MASIDPSLLFNASENKDLMRVESLGSSPDVLLRVYVHSESDVEQALSLAWDAARKKTAQALIHAEALFKTAHGKPVITRELWRTD